MNKFVRAKSVILVNNLKVTSADLLHDLEYLQHETKNA